MTIVETLRNALGPDVVTPGPESDPRFHRDWTATRPVVPLAVVLPRTTTEVSTVLRLCHEAGAGVVPQGGMSGLVGGAMPVAGSIALNLSRLAGPIAIDARARTATLDAGTPLQTLQEAAQMHGLAFPVDLGARGSCQIGGMIATNAGGVQVLQHGMMRQQVLGLEAVLADGTVLSSMRGLIKNNTGYDLTQLLTGSEGTLAVITRAILRLVPASPARATALLAVPDLDAGHAVLDHMLRAPARLCAFEAMWPSYYRYACETVDAAPLAPHAGLTLLIEVEGHDHETLQDTLLAALETLFNSGAVSDAAVAQSKAHAAAFWALREANEGLFQRFAQIIGFDVSLPGARMAGFHDGAVAQVHRFAPNATVLCFGHLGDGNLHLAVAGDSFDAEAVKTAVMGLVGDMGGSISAEHGIGRDKRAFLSLSRGATEIAVMRQIKQALDPRGILNPGVLFQPADMAAGPA